MHDGLDQFQHVGLAIQSGILANLSQVLAGFAFDLINLAFLNHANSSDGDVYGLIFLCRFSLYITT